MKNGKTRLMENRPYRVLLHAMTFQRDFALAYILSQILETMGCECLIANNATLHAKYFKLWKPNAVFLVTLTHAKHINASYPEAKLFLWAAEGGYAESEELSIIGDEVLENLPMRVFLWGNGTLEAAREKIKKLKLSTTESSFFLDKCSIMGNPRMDLCKFRPHTKKSEHDKIKIGFIGNFYYINNIKRHPFDMILNYEFATPRNTKNLPEMLFQIQQIKTFCDLIHDLGHDKYAFSLRPYPLENIENYAAATKNNTPALEIGDEIDFVSWMAKQDILIGATSTTIAQIATMGKPYINIDKLDKRPDRQYDRQIDRGLKNNKPATYPELLAMISDYKKHTLNNPVIQDHIKLYHNEPQEGSTILKVARDIHTNLKKAPKASSGIISTKLAARFDKMWCAYLERKAKKELRCDYSYFNAARIIPRAAREFMPLVENILKTIEH